MEDKYKSIQVSATEERRIVTGLIVSDVFCTDIVPKIYLDYFTNNYLRKIATWCLDFYAKYSKAPGKHIQDIFEDKKNNLEEIEAELIENLLVSLSDQYTDANSLNTEYLVESAVTYFRKRELEIHRNNIEVLLLENKISEAEQEVERFQRVTLDLDTSLYIDPGDFEQRKELYEKYEKKQRHFFKMPGDMGEFIGNIKQGDLVGITAPAKRGKTLVYDTLIPTASGSLKTIKDIVENKEEYVLTMNAEGEIVPGKVIDWIYSGEKDECTVQTVSGYKIHGAITHPFLTREGWKPLGKLKPKEEVAIARNQAFFGNLSLPEAELKFQGYLLTILYVYNTELFLIAPNASIREDVMKTLEELGNPYEKGEGNAVKLLPGPAFTKYINQEGYLKGEIGINYSTNLTKESMARIIEVAISCSCMVSRNGDNLSILYMGLLKPSVVLLQQYLAKFGIIGKVLDRENPMKDIIHIPAQLDIFCYILINDPVSIYNFLNNLEINPSYDSKAANFIAAYEEEYYTRILHKQNLNYINQDIYWDEIREIEISDEKIPMYDLTIEDTHNFVANSFVVHNSFLLNDFMKHLILQKKKVVKWAIEMTDVEEMIRFDKLFHPTVDHEDGEYMYPVFDCFHNQMGDCAERNSSVIVRNRVDELPIINPEHVVCTKCRGVDYMRFNPCTYSVPIYRERGEGQKIIYEMQNLSSLLSKYSRIVVRPKYSLTYDLMMYDLDKLYRKSGFIPQVLELDYIDILQITSKHTDYKLEDEKWTLMQKLASATKCAVITPTQANKTGAENHTLRSTDQGGFYGKGRHVNLMLGINQTPLEKQQGIYRLSILDGRSIRTNENDFCLVLQDLKAGQMHLDSYWPFKNMPY